MSGPRRATASRGPATGPGGDAHPLPALAKGTALGLAVCGVALAMPGEMRHEFLAALLALAAGVYVGFASESGPRERRVQWAAALGFTAAGLAGAWLWPPLLAGAWAAHGGWDLRHHRGGRPLRVAAGYPSLCLAFDLVVAGFVLLGWAVA